MNNDSIKLSTESDAVTSNNRTNKIYSSNIQASGINGIKIH